MNVRTDPESFRLSPPPLPAKADAPIRSAFLHDEMLRRLGATLARGDLGRIEGLKVFDISRRIRENSEKILTVYRATNEAQLRGETITPAAQWLLDNHYMIEEAVYQIRRDLPRRCV